MKGNLSLIVMILTFVSLISCDASRTTKDYSSYVNPFIGTGGHGHTFPGPVVPQGMIQPGPDTRIYEWDACSGYHYDDNTINGFSHTHLSGTGCGDLGDILLMPTVGEQKYHSMGSESQQMAYASSFSHKNDDIYAYWLNNKISQHTSSYPFKIKGIPLKKLNKYIPMPPPNITGKLHMGHALFLTIQDSLSRFYKTCDYNTLWLPGLDHAGLATHDKIIAYQKENTCSYEEASHYISSTHKEIILKQIQKLGALPDWDLLTYTMDND